MRACVSSLVCPIIGLASFYCFVSFRYCLTSSKQFFSHVRDGATAFWVLPVLLGSKCVLLKDGGRYRTPTSRSGVRHANHCVLEIKCGEPESIQLFHLDRQIPLGPCIRVHDLCPGRRARQIAGLNLKAVSFSSFSTKQQSKSWLVSEDSF